ncbi:MAG: hypothetical protein WC807_04485 [Hyphomicrobium sp.]|jgi:hypothetical protein
MRVLRRRSGFAMLALVALVAQILCSAWHTHGLEASERASNVLVEAYAPKVPGEPLPPPDDDGDDCQLCWVIALATAAVLGAAMAGLAPVPRGRTPKPPCRDAVLPRLATASFRARGPPLKECA